MCENLWGHHYASVSITQPMAATQNMRISPKHKYKIEMDVMLG
jgi:hypothetical protein